MVYDDMHERYKIPNLRKRAQVRRRKSYRRMFPTRSLLTATCSRETCMVRSHQQLLPPCEVKIIFLVIYNFTL